VRWTYCICIGAQKLNHGSMKQLLCPHHPNTRAAMHPGGLVLLLVDVISAICLSKLCTTASQCTNAATARNMCMQLFQNLELQAHMLLLLYVAEDSHHW
jgi:hypothetical protein